ncbi:PGCA protein, partial [Alectura lathami]|nr:PGCA protein [Alectura lathami]
MTHPLFFLLFGALVLSSSESADNSTVKHRNARFLFEVLPRLNPESNEIPNPPLPDLSAEQTCRSPCQKGWISYKGHCYVFIQKRMTWTEAEKSCGIERVGSHLASITSAEENEFLCKLTKGQTKTQFWTGGTYQKAILFFFCLQGSLLKWSDGSLITFLQRPLSSIFSAVRGLFNNLFNTKICLAVNIGGGGEWNGSPCSTKLPFICSYKPDLVHL